MCGLFAFFSRGEINKEKLMIEANKISHRGPDSTTALSVDKGFVVFHRLSINDLSSNGDQPFVYDNAILLCNGEIYNYRKLKLKYGIETKSGSDCEIILHLYKKIGIEATLKELDGYFAFIIIDYSAGSGAGGGVVHICRDRLGVRSLFIGKNSYSISIASEMKAIHSLSYDIDQVPPASYQTWDLSTLTLLKSNKYYELPIVQYFSVNGSESKYIRDYLELAVVKRLMTDRPFGCLLSGGLDSSLIVSILSKILAKDNKRLETFSIGMVGSTDIEYARIVAKHCNTIHHEVIVTKEQMLSSIPKVIEQIESYDTTSVRASTPMYLLCKYIKENTDIKVIFSGEGSDEVLGGYLYFHKSPDSESFKEENYRLLSDIHFFDCLRADKCISAHGLEGRFPFLDVDFVNYCMSIDSKLKMPTNNRIEKYLLRIAFSTGDYLPDEVLWRVKEAFSDGVSKQDNSWYKIIQDHLEGEEAEEAGEAGAEDEIYEHCQPVLKESFYYRRIYDKIYPRREKLIPYYWLPKWSSNEKDPSARELKFSPSPSLP